jgi:hypothetical protein
MIRLCIAVCALFSPILFPFWFSVGIVGVASFFSPSVPLAVGLFADAVYYVPGVYGFPLYSVVGGMLTVSLIFIHRFVKTSIIQV